jgi:hypothetical protein
MQLLTDFSCHNWIAESATLAVFPLNLTVADAMDRVQPACQEE